jgi:hypothetical protein
MRTSAIGLLIVWSMSCGRAVDPMVPPLPEPEPPPLTDGGSTTPDAGAPRLLSLELGTGAPGTFTPVLQGQQVLLQRGCQGAQHIFFSLRATGVVAERPRLTLSVERVSDGRVASLAYSLPLPYQRVRGNPWVEWTGLTPVIEEPSDVLNTAVRMRARIDDEGLSAEQAQEVTVRWGPDSCRPHP